MSISRRIVNYIGWALAIVFGFLAVISAVVPAIFGGMALTVLSGSMQPTFNPGDRIITAAVQPDEIKIGDIISYLPNPDDPTLITHRVIGMGASASEGKSFTLQGDNNSAVDNPVYAKQVRFRYLYHIPYLGYVVDKVGGQTGWVVTVVAVILIAYGIWLVFRPDKNPKRALEPPDGKAPLTDRPRRIAK